MKKILIILGLILASLLTIGGCKVETSTGTSYGLTIEKAFWAKMSEDGKFIPIGDTFEVGEKINFVLLNVGEFKKGDDGLNWYDMDVETRDSEGNIIDAKQGLLGEEGHMDLPDNIATPYTYFTTNVPPGTYKTKLTIYDKIGGGSASKTKSFTVE